MNEDLFGSIKQTITETAGAVGKKTEEFVETQKSRTKCGHCKERYGKNMQISVKSYTGVT